MKKLLYVCLDGLGDDPIPEFDGRTPLEAAVTPAMTHSRAAGRTGIVVTVGDGIAPESDIARLRDPRATTREASTPAGEWWRRSAPAWTSRTATWPTG